jgi:hypothetical protein
MKKKMGKIEKELVDGWGGWWMQNLFLCISYSNKKYVQFTVL